MAYKVTISDGTILEKSIESVTFNADLPADTSYCIRTYTINSMQITGRIGAGEKTISLYEWALLPANDPDCYKEIVVEQTHADQIVRNVKFSKAFVVDYSESYSKGSGVGLFSIFIRQLAEVDIECTNEVTQQITMPEVSNEVEEQRSLPVQAVGISTLSNTKNTVMEKATDTRKDAEQRLIPGRLGVVTGGNSIKLGKNMIQSMGLKRSAKWSGYQAQHIIPAEMVNNPVLQKIGMDLDDTSNGIFLRIPDAEISPMSRHQGFHSIYNEVVEGALNRMDITQSTWNLQKQVFDLQQNLKYLQQKGLPLYPSQGATVELWERQLGKLNKFM